MQTTYTFQIGEHFIISIHIKIEQTICITEIEGQFQDMEEGVKVFAQMQDCLSQIITQHQIKKILLNLKIYSGNTGTFAVTLYRFFNLLEYWTNEHYLEIEICFVIDTKNLDMIEHAEEFEEFVQDSYPKFTCQIINRD